jgi:flavorubredoxin
MNAQEIKPGVYWVGGIDWDIRNFHGYKTQRGTTYNAYLIVDEKVTLVDTVKRYLFDEMLARIREIVDPSQIEYIVSNHVEMDHSGSLPKILEHAPDAAVITSTRGEKGLRNHYATDLPLQVVKSGETLSIGKRMLHFIHIPMVHWPDSMVTYSPHDALLLPNDAFGQHIASAERFDDELGWSLVKEEAAKYYANIVMPYGSQVEKALSGLADLEIDMIAPSHGIIWRSHLPDILKEYGKWARHEADDRALIVYDSMWGSTEKMAYALREGIEDASIPVTMKNLKKAHISDVITDVLRSSLILLGSPTLNKTMLPTMGGFLTYLTGLNPQKKIGFVFGSYGWGGQAVDKIEKTLTDLSWEMPVAGMKITYVPTEKQLEETKDRGRALGNYLTR